MQDLKNEDYVKIIYEDKEAYGQIKYVYRGGITTDKDNVLVTFVNSDIVEEHIRKGTKYEGCVQAKYLTLSTYNEYTNYMNNLKRPILEHNRTKEIHYHESMIADLENQIY